jgi:tetratricopeptide (TPR) repeat protein
MKQFFTTLNSVLAVVLLFSSAGLTIMGQGVTTPRAASPAASVSQTIGLSRVTIEYSRPAVKERDVYGTNLVHYGYENLGFGTSEAAPWRAGANENTIITFSDDATVEGQPIPAGTYALFMALHKDGKADIIFSNNSSSWGSYFYDSMEDQLKVSVTTEEIPFTERLTFDFIDIDDQSTTAVLDWEQKRFPFKVAFDVNQIVLANAKDELRGTKGFGWQGPSSAANYCLQNNVDLEQGMKWADQAVNNNKNFNTLYVKAGLTKAMGNDAGALYDEAAGLATKNQLNFLGYQLMTAGDQQRALDYFKTNLKNNPDDPNMYDSLADCYKNMGENKDAIKNFKKSLSMNPPQNVKANSIKNLKELGVDTSEYVTDI